MKQDEARLASYLAVRTWIGVLGMALPVVLIVGGYINADASVPAASISDYYYTVMGNIFTGVLLAVAILLFTYKGYDEPIVHKIRFFSFLKDGLITNIAAVGALGVVLFPYLGDYIKCDYHKYIPLKAVTIIHFGSAAVFLFTSACLSYWGFTNKPAQGGVLTTAKKKRNFWYRTLGIVMVLALLFILLTKLGILKLPFDSTTFWGETVALEAFGIAWLIKGESLRTRKSKEKEAQEEVMLLARLPRKEQSPPRLPT